MEYLSDHFEPRMVLDDVLSNQHKDRDMASLLVKKLKLGCEQWINAQSLGETGQPEGSEIMAKHPNFKHVSKTTQYEKLKQIIADL